MNQSPDDIRWLHSDTRTAWLSFETVIMEYPASSTAACAALHRFWQMWSGAACEDPPSSTASKPWHLGFIWRQSESPESLKKGRLFLFATAQCSYLRSGLPCGDWLINMHSPDLWCLALWNCGDDERFGVPPGSGQVLGGLQSCTTTSEKWLLASCWMALDTPSIHRSRSDLRSSCPFGGLAAISVLSA